MTTYNGASSFQRSLALAVFFIGGASYAADADLPRKSLLGESCVRTADCEGGLRCLSNVCQGGGVNSGQPVPVQQYQPAPPPPSVDQRQLLLEEAELGDRLKYAGGTMIVAGALSTAAGIGLVAPGDSGSGTFVGGVVLTVVGALGVLIGIPLTVVGAMKQVAYHPASGKLIYAHGDFGSKKSTLNVNFYASFSEEYKGFSLEYSY